MPLHKRQLAQRLAAKFGMTQPRSTGGVVSTDRARQKSSTLCGRGQGE